MASELVGGTGVEPGSLLTTSASLTAAIALSLQETLGNMVAGLAIQVQRPFDVDDWIQFDSEKTHTLANAPIVNFTKPSRASRRSLYIYAPVDVPPHLVQRTILEALVGSLGVLREPPASVVTNAFVEGNVEYWVRLFTDQFHRRDVVDGTARDRIWYALRRIGVTPKHAFRPRGVRARSRRPHQPGHRPNARPPSSKSPPPPPCVDPPPPPRSGGPNSSAGSASFSRSSSSAALWSR